MKFTLEIDCEGAAFGETDAERCEEIARILRRTAERFQTNLYAAPITRGLVDLNGNTVGQWTLDAEEASQ